MMATHQSPGQRKTVERVMHEYKHGELKTARGARKVKNPKQAIAIALHEAGASKYESPKKNARNLRRTKAKERRGETGQDAAEGRGRKKASSKRSTTTKRTASAAARSSSATRSARAKPASGSKARTGGKRTSSAAKSSSAKRTSSAAKSSGTKRSSAAKRTTAAGRRRGSADGKTRAELYAEATRRKISGRSRMSKAQLERALQR